MSRRKRAEMKRNVSKRVLQVQPSPPPLLFFLVIAKVTKVAYIDETNICLWDAALKCIFDRKNP